MELFIIIIKYRAEVRNYTKVYKLSYEACGNIVYPLSKIDAYKIVYGLTMPQTLFSGINDYIKGYRI